MQFRSSTNDCDRSPQYLVELKISPMAGVFDNFPGDPVAEFMLQGCEELRGGQSIGIDERVKSFRPFQSFSVC